MLIQIRFLLQLKKSIIALYSPKKQKLNNYDVIESYAEDFTRWRIDNTGVTTTQKKITIAANTKLKYNIAYKGFGNSTDGFDIKYTGNIVMRGGTALGLSIGALGLQLLGGGLLNGGLFGNRAAVAETAAIAGTAANEQYLERKQCADHVQFVNDMWRSTYAQQNQRFEDRQTINQEMFGIYSAMRNGFDVINAAANQNALIMIFRPFIDKAADKSISKVDKFLKMIQEEDGTVDIEPLLGKMTDNLIVAATKEYPDLFGGVTIGNGKIKIGVPGIDKDIVLEAADIDHFKSCLK